MMRLWRKQAGDQIIDFGCPEFTFAAKELSLQNFPDAKGYVRRRYFYDQLLDLAGQAVATIRHNVIPFSFPVGQSRTTGLLLWNDSRRRHIAL